MKGELRLLSRVAWLFIVVPVVDLILLVKLAQVAGTGFVFLFIICSSVLGGSLAKAQGLRVVQETQAAMARGETPQHGLVDRLLIFAGGVLLVIPGVLSDLAGLACVMPGTRTLLKNSLRRRLETMVANGQFQFRFNSPHRRQWM